MINMQYMDPHIHMISRTTDDYENMAKAGVVAVVEPAFWQGQPRTGVSTFIDYFDMLVGWERFRAKQFGIMHFCTMGLNPKEANNRALADEVMKVIPRYLSKSSVLAIGEIGYDDMTPAEEYYFQLQLEMAKEYQLPALVHTPHRDKIKGTKRTLALVKEVGIDEEMVLVDHLNEQTLPLVKATGCWCGHSIYPQTKMSEERMVKLLQQYGSEKMVVNSAADWGKSDPLKVPKTGVLMAKSGFSEQEITKVLFENPINYYAQSGKISLEDIVKPRIDQSELYQENSALRGQSPIVES
jgi:predicted metal-dependent TIM-barrel fold hydrolase